MPRLEKVRLGEILLRQGLLTEAELKTALDDQKRTGRRLGRLFIDSRFVTEEKICQALARQLRISFVDLRQVTPKLELLGKLPESQARRYRAIVLEDLGATYRVGMADPTDLPAYDELSRILKREIEPAVVAESQLLAAIDRGYARTEGISGLAQELGDEVGDAAVSFTTLATSAGADEAQVVKLLQSVFGEALRVRAGRFPQLPRRPRRPPSAEP